MDGYVRVDGLVERSRSDIELLAIETDKRRVDVTSAIPVDVQLLLEKTRNVRLATMDGLVYRHGVEGCVCSQFMSRTLTVYVDTDIANDTVCPDKPDALAKFYAVLGEELAHIVLHRAIIMQVEDVKDFLAVRRNPLWLRIEQDAQQFSAALRMPSKLVRTHGAKAYADIVSEEGFADPMRVGDLVCARLAREFVVSESEMRVRLLEWPCQLLPAVIASAHRRALALETDVRSDSELLVRTNLQALIALQFGTGD